MKGLEVEPMCSRHEDIHNFVMENWEAVVADIAKLVSIESTEDLSSRTSNSPWGPGPRKALDAALLVAERLGLEPHDCNGMIGYADVPGDVAGQIATIAHLDVVPAGPGWTTNPFSLVRRDGCLVGRGVLDDKGPAVLTLWVAHFLRKKSSVPRRSVRIMLGVNEETGMGDARWYVKHYKAPDFLFTPDAVWPVVCGEKGSYNAELSWSPAPDGRIVEISGGTARNAIAANAYAVVRADYARLSPAADIELSSCGSKLVRIEAHGTGGHAAEPDGKTSAIGLLIDYILDNGIYSNPEKMWLDFESLVYSSTDGSAFGIKADDDVFSPLTVISGTMKTDGGKFVQSIDCRYPKSVNADWIAEGIERTCKNFGIGFAEVHRGMPLFVSPDSDEVQMLMHCYSEWFDRNAHPVTLGGGTYAKRFPKAVAFGPAELDPVLPSWAGGIHGPNEAVSEQLMQRSLCTYIDALDRLSSMKVMDA